MHKHLYEFIFQKKLTQKAAKLRITLRPKF